MALARILVGQPKILMLDEPFSALDSHLRDQMEREVLALIRDFGGTTLLVSHSRDEVFRMADQVAVYDNGRIDALDEKHRLFQSPKTYCAALLTGCKNFSRLSDLQTLNHQTTFHADDWNIDLTVPGTGSGDMVGIRGHHLRLAESPGPDVYEMEITGVIEDTFEYVLLLRRPGSSGTPIHWMISKEAYQALPSAPLLIRFPSEALMLLKN